jgi:hypothetical protein
MSAQDPHRHWRECQQQPDPQDFDFKSAGQVARICLKFNNNQEKRNNFKIYVIG